ncbi:putative sodium-dependent multivitamin transporter [Monomorium pharaonis]|uniref:putative sodium-dependent multivitamin transporter n=1 Tax=Monomorium pharaonis TaxID=307658 RepID=UPI0017471B7F|nr:putative sodium-dependent multivitamin transporter [Monomorium pharaonis]
MDVNTTNTFIKDETEPLQWQDYFVISTLMLISVIIGLYYRFSGDRQRTVTEYFLADNSLGISSYFIFPFATMASYVSGVIMLGKTGESYTYGLIIVLMYLTDVYVVPIVVLCYLPVFYKLKILSIYEYLERRFGLYTRLLVSVTNFIDTILLNGVLLYIPSLALEATTGLSSATSILILATVCIFYSTLGGIKAVLMTGVFQGLFMTIALCIVIGTIADNIDGGIGAIWSIAREGQRIDFSEWTADPTVQYTGLSLLFGGGSMCLTYLGVTQVHIQRLLTSKNLKIAINALFLSGPFISLAGILICFAGLSLYAIYKDCDPVASEQISTYDKILPHFTVENLSPGVIGLIVSGIFSAIMSTISAIINSLAAVALEDYVKPLSRKYGRNISDKKAIFIAKLLTVLNGIICICVALLADTVDKVSTVAFKIHGAVSGPILGIFTLGMINESANEMGSIIGMITALIVCLWAGFGQPKPPVPKLPVSIEGCANSTAWMFTEQMDFNSTIQPDQSSYFYLYRISYLWHNLMGMTITLVVGYVASIVVRLIRGGNNIEHDPSLFIPFLATRIKRRRQDAQKTTNSQLFVLDDLR